MAEKLPDAGSGETPTPTQEKTVDITENGTHTVTPDDGYALSKVTANVSVPIPDGYIVPSGTKSITENGTHDAKAYESVSVNVPVPDGYIIPSGTKEITENGTHDVANFAEVNVDVEGSGVELFFISSGAIYVEELVVPETVTALNSGVYNINGFKSITALGVTELKGHYCFGGAWNSLEVLICPRLTSWPGNYWCRGGNLKEVQAGSIGYPVTAMLNAKGFDLNSRSDLVITIYVDATTLAEVPTDVSDYAPFGATKATIVYRNSTTGEVISE
jgi:hypothetical protein